MDFFTTDDVVNFFCNKSKAFARGIMEKLKFRISEMESTPKKNNESPNEGEDETDEIDEIDEMIENMSKTKKENKSKAKKNSKMEITYDSYNSNLCLAKVKSGCQCSRKPRDGSLFCGLHKTQKYGCVVDINEYKNSKKNQITQVQESKVKVNKKHSKSKSNNKSKKSASNQEQNHSLDKIDTINQITADTRDAKEILLDVMLEQGIMHNINHKKPDFKNEKYSELNDDDEEGVESEDEYEDIEI
jgi:hypothetical protein